MSPGARRPRPLCLRVATAGSRVPLRGPECSEISVLGMLLRTIFTSVLRKQRVVRGDELHGYTRRKAEPSVRPEPM